ncbi:MAG: hypothetical protein IPM13_02755 [Phycisphaerales bacterium]|nr:hypothetical protein [Phycisphaerales bacterium]
MANWQKSLGPGLVALMCLAVVAGCGGSNPRLAKNEFAGKWLEQPPEAVPGMPRQSDKLRILELLEDNTFKMTIADMSGKPVEPAQSASGTYRIDGPTLRFTTTAKNFTEDPVMSVPRVSIEIRLKARGHDSDSIQIRDENGLRTTYVRQ